jgi:two-component system cell cycle response regulator
MFRARTGEVETMSWKAIAIERSLRGHKPLLFGRSPDEESTGVSAIVVDEPLGGAIAPTPNDCLIVICTKEPLLLGRRFVLGAKHLRIGRGSENDIVVEGERVSRRHAHFEQRDGAWWCVDDKSTNGSYVNDVRIVGKARLASGDQIKMGAMIFKFLSGHDVEAQFHEAIYRMTIIDGLTQVYVKRYLLESLEKEAVRARRHHRDLAFLMFDIDHFREINNVFLHVAGDYVLKEVARLVQQRIRRDEVFGRYGGDEFAIILPETNLAGARSLAEGLREQIRQHRFAFQGKTMSVSLSIGGSMWQAADREITNLIQRADEKLFEAKRAGRNRVLV